MPAPSVNGSAPNSSAKTPNASGAPSSGAGQPGVGQSGALSSRDLPPGALVGISADRLPGAKYAAELNFVEFAPRDPIPKPNTLRKWREGCEVSVALVAPKSATISAKGALRLTGEGAVTTEQTVLALEALQAQILVLDTGSALSPGQRDRDFLAKYVEHIRESFSGTVCWSPGGLWEPDAAASVASTLGLLLARDPLDTPLDGRARYGRVQAAGSRSRISDGMLEAIQSQLESLGNEENSFITFRSERSFQEATRLRALLSAP